MLLSSDLVLAQAPAVHYRTKKINLILIGGRAGVGKTTAGNYMQTHLSKLHGLRVALSGFANPVKDIARSVFKWDGKKDDKGRRLLQVIGTDAGRDYNENIWVEYFLDSQLNSLFPNHIVLVDDWRFPNEKSFFEKDFLFDIITIRVERKDNPALSEESMQHISENALPVSEIESLVYNENEYYNFTVFNDGTVEDFHNKLDSVLNYLETKIIEY